MLVSGIKYTNFNKNGVNFKKKRQNTNSVNVHNNSVSHKVSAQKLLPLFMALSLSSCGVEDVFKRNYDDFDKQPSKLAEQKNLSMLSVTELFEKADLKIGSKGENGRKFSISTEIGDFDGTIKMDEGIIRGELNTDEASYDYTMKLYSEGNIKAKLNLKNKKTKETQNVIIAEDQKKNLVLIDKFGSTHMLTDKLPGGPNGLSRTLLVGCMMLPLILLNLALWPQVDISEFIDRMKYKYLFEN